MHINVTLPCIRWKIRSFIDNYCVHLQCSNLMNLKSAKNRFQLSAGLNLEPMNTILSKTNHI